MAENDEVKPAKNRAAKASAKKATAKTAAKVAPILVYILCELVNPGDDAFAVNFVLIVTLLGVGARSLSLSLSLSLSPYTMHMYIYELVACTACTFMGIRDKRQLYTASDVACTALCAYVSLSLSLSLCVCTHVQTGG